MTYTVWIPEATRPNHEFCGYIPYMLYPENHKQSTSLIFRVVVMSDLIEVEIP